MSGLSIIPWTSLDLHGSSVFLHLRYELDSERVLFFHKPKSGNSAHCKATNGTQTRLYKSGQFITTFPAGWSPLSWWWKVRVPSPPKMAEQIRLRITPKCPKIAQINPSLFPFFVPSFEFQSQFFVEKSRDERHPFCGLAVLCLLSWIWWQEGVTKKDFAHLIYIYIYIGLIGLLIFGWEVEVGYGNLRSPEHYNYRKHYFSGWWINPRLQKASLSFWVCRCACKELGKICRDHLLSDYAWKHSTFCFLSECRWVVGAEIQVAHFDIRNPILHCMLLAFWGGEFFYLYFLLTRKYIQISSNIFVWFLYNIDYILPTYFY